MSDDAILHRILEKLGSIEAGQNQLRSDFDRERDRSRESRGDLHEKVDAVGDRLSHLETTVQVAGQVTAQARERIAAMEETLTDDVKPTVDEFKRMKLIGWSVVSIVGLGGTAFGASLIWWGEQMISALRSLLRIP
jgi:hypothetical protein